MGRAATPLCATDVDLYQETVTSSGRQFDRRFGPRIPFSTEQTGTPLRWSRLPVVG
jgi:hypothetical protein